MVDGKWNTPHNEVDAEVWEYIGEKLPEYVSLNFQAFTKGRGWHLDGLDWKTLIDRIYMKVDPNETPKEQKFSAMRYVMGRHYPTVRDRANDWLAIIGKDREYLESLTPEQRALVVPIGTKPDKPMKAIETPAAPVVPEFRPDESAKPSAIKAPKPDEMPVAPPRYQARRGLSGRAERTLCVEPGGSSRGNQERRGP
jgi:hypothetical protein